MGIIRKSLMVSTGGIVRGSSKKQRVAKAQLKQLEAQTRAQQATAAAAVKQAEAVAAAVAAAPAPAPAQLSAPAPTAAPAAPAQGWYPSPNQPGQLQWWDGAAWAESFAPVSPQ
ncbi:MULTISPECIES: DUF2510 domain-containing protein [Amycolatopsis]|uniref:DUF2510 domain-containing protein n=1 Tax=Amycolatopsis sp. cg13 TaxID=3238807 RepID=UPI003525861D